MPCCCFLRMMSCMPLPLLDEKASAFTSTCCMLPAVTFQCSREHLFSELRVMSLPSNQPIPAEEQIEAAKVHRHTVFPAHHHHTHSLPPPCLLLLLLLTTPPPASAHKAWHKASMAYVCKACCWRWMEEGEVGFSLHTQQACPKKNEK